MALRQVVQRLPGEAGPGEFAALHGQANICGPLVAVDNLDGKTERGLQRARDIRRVSPRPDAAELDRLLGRKPFLHGGNAARFGNPTSDVIRAGSAQVFKFLAVEFDPLGAHDLLEEQSSSVVADDEAIRFGLQVHEVGVNDAAGAGHVLNDNGRVAGNMLAQMAPDGA